MTQLSALIYFIGVWVKISQSRTVPSPDPEARFLQSGLKLRESTASVCPYILFADLVTGLTLKLETGW